MVYKTVSELSLQNIPVTVDDRIWMKAAKSWRVMLSLALANTLLPPVLTNMIDKQYRFEIHNDSIRVEIEPAAIIDVPHKKKVFHLVIETVYEHQRSIGALLTGLVGESATMSILPLGTKALMPPQQEPPAPPKRTADEAKSFMTGLHVLFNNPKFQEFISIQSGQQIANANVCKSIFKDLAGVESCKDLTSENFKTWLDKFNAWINGR